MDAQWCTWGCSKLWKTVPRTNRVPTRVTLPRQNCVFTQLLNRHGKSHSETKEAGYDLVATANQPSGVATICHRDDVPAGIQCVDAAGDGHWPPSPCNHLTTTGFIPNNSWCFKLPAVCFTIRFPTFGSQWIQTSSFKQFHLQHGVKPCVGRVVALVGNPWCGRRSSLSRSRWWGERLPQGALYSQAGRQRNSLEAKSDMQCGVKTFNSSADIDHFLDSTSGKLGSKCREKTRFATHDTNGRFLLATHINPPIFQRQFCFNGSGLLMWIFHNLP